MTFADLSNSSWTNEECNFRQFSSQPTLHSFIGITISDISILQNPTLSDVVYLIWLVFILHLSLSTQLFFFLYIFLLSSLIKKYYLEIRQWVRFFFLFFSAGRGNWLIKLFCVFLFLCIIKIFIFFWFIFFHCFYFYLFIF